MTEQQNKLVEAITKLIKLTQQGKLNWSSRAGEKLNREDRKMDTFFITRYKEKILRLYEYHYRVDEPGPFDRIRTIFTDKERNYPYWASSINLEFIDEAGNKIWTFPYHRVFNDLLEAVRYQVSGVDDFLNDIFKE